MHEDRRQFDSVSAFGRIFAGNTHINRIVGSMSKKSEAVKKTNVARLLDKAGCDYELVPYEVDEEHLSAVDVAAQLGEDISCVYKTIVLHGERSGYFVCVVRGDNEIDLKTAANVSGNKKAELVHVKDLLALTGYIRGGCSPIGMKKPFPTYFESGIMQHDKVFVSAGQRGLQLKISPADLVAYTKGKLF